MKNVFRNMAVLLMAGALCGCIISLHPLFSPNEAIYEPALTGVWESKDEDGALFSTVSIKGSTETKRYFINATFKDEPASPGEFGGELGAIGKNRFLQIVPKRPASISGKSFFGGHFVQGFTFWKVTLKGDRLILSALNYDWVEGLLKLDKTALDHTQRDGERILLTASTKELKAFVEKYSEDTNAFSTTIELKRKK